VIRRRLGSGRAHGNSNNLAADCFAWICRRCLGLRTAEDMPTQSRWAWHPTPSTIFFAAIIGGFSGSPNGSDGLGPDAQHSKPGKCRGFPAPNLPTRRRIVDGVACHPNLSFRDSRTTSLSGAKPGSPKSQHSFEVALWTGAGPGRRPNLRRGKPRIPGSLRYSSVSSRLRAANSCSICSARESSSG
jgi:hypothetical protein